jgi:hypothetical protein
MRRAAIVVGVVGVLALAAWIVYDQLRPAQPITSRTLGASVGDHVGSAFPDMNECRPVRGAGRTRWECLAIDSEGSGGGTYDVVLRGRCWTAALTNDASERHDMPRRAHGCVPRH